MRCWILIALFLVGCGKEIDKVHIDTIFNPYVARWESTYGIKVNVDVRMVHLDSPNVGICGPDGILIDTDYWDRSSDYGREQLMYHEFGHCLLGLGHDKDRVTINGNDVYKSIMNPIAFGNSLMYQDNRDYYVEELKTSRASEHSTSSLSECKEGDSHE